MTIWLILFIVGLLLFVLEVFCRNLFCISFGAASLCTGIINIIAHTDILVSILIFLMISLMNIFFLKNLLNKLLVKRNERIVKFDKENSLGI